jgi:hypothetical protein
LKEQLKLRRMASSKLSGLEFYYTKVFKQHVAMFIKKPLFIKVVTLNIFTISLQKKFVLGK